MPDYKLKKVDFDPFKQDDDVKLVPVDFDPFEKTEIGDSGISEAGPGFIETLSAENPIEPPSKQTISNLYTPILEGLGSAGGGIAGSGVGPAGTILGGGGGFVVGKNTAELIDNMIGLKQPKTIAQELSEMPAEYATGMAYELVGAGVGAGFRAGKEGGKWVFKKAREFTTGAFTKKGQEKIAAETLRAYTSEGVIYAKNAQEAKEIEEAIPGLKFTLGERTSDPSIIGIERAKQEATAKYEQLLRNNEALKKYYASNFKGGDIDDMIFAIQNGEDALKNAAKQTQKEVNKLASELPVNDPSMTGEKLIDTLKAAKTSTRAKAEFLYQAVDDMDINIVGLKDELKDIAKKTSRFEDDKNIPEILSKVIKDFKDKNIAKLVDLRGLRTNVGDLLRGYQKSITPNPAMEKRLNKVINAINKAIEESEGDEGIKLALKEANKFYKQDYVEVFRQRGVGELLRRGSSGEASKVPLERIPGKIWADKKSLYYANSIKKAIGDAADPIVEEYATYDMLRSVKDVNGDISSKQLNKWLSNNEKLLKKFNIYNKFKNIKESQEIVDIAISDLKEFEKNVAKNVLGADPENVIAATLSGKDYVKRTNDILKTIGKDKAALRGYQNAFADHVIEKIRINSENIALKPNITNEAIEKALKKYDNVMRILYKNDPAKYNALQTMRRAYQIASRSSIIKASGNANKIHEIKIGGPALLKREVVIAKWIGKLVNKYRGYQVDEFITRALFDPDYGEALINSVSKEADIIKVENNIDRLMLDLFKSRTIQAGFVSTSESLKQNQ